MNERSTRPPAPNARVSESESPEMPQRRVNMRWPRSALFESHIGHHPRSVPHPPANKLWAAQPPRDATREREEMRDALMTRPSNGQFRKRRLTILCFCSFYEHEPQTRTTGTGFLIGCNRLDFSVGSGHVCRCEGWVRTSSGCVVQGHGPCSPLPRQATALYGPKQRRQPELKDGSVPLLRIRRNA